MKSEGNLLPSCLIKNCSLNNGEKKDTLRKGLCYTIITYYKRNKIIIRVTRNNGVTYTLSTENSSRGGFPSPLRRNNGTNLVIIIQALSHTLPSNLSLQEVLCS